MAIDYVGDRRLHTYVVSGSAVAAKTVKLLGVRVGIVQGAAAVGETAVVDFEGVYSGVAKLSTDVLADGDVVYWDAGNSRMTSTATSNTKAGYAVGAYGNPTSTMTIALAGGA